ncbi:hypothetical protein BH10BAC1_BH10BAC1_18170 [soil metagenome]
MNQLTFLTIKEPCHQGWENMSLSKKGRFCSSCKKNVHDFSNSTIDEIKKVYFESSDGVCGHVPVKLLQEQYVERGIQQVHYSFVKKFCLAAMLCFGANLFTIDAAKASTFYNVKTAFFNFVSSSSNDTILVKGIVQDKKTLEKLPFVNVVVYYNDTVIFTTVTNIEGEYQVKISAEYLKVDIKAVNIGYVSKLFKSITIAPNKQIVVDFDLEEDMQMLDGIMIMEQEPLFNVEPGPTGKTIKRKESENKPK